MVQDRALTTQEPFGMPCRQLSPRLATGVPAAPMIRVRCGHSSPGRRVTTSRGRPARPLNVRLREEWRRPGGSVGCLTALEHLPPLLVGEAVRRRPRELVVRVDPAAADVELPLGVGYQHVDAVDAAGSDLQHLVSAGFEVDAAHDVGDDGRVVIDDGVVRVQLLARAPPEALERPTDGLEPPVVILGQPLAPRWNSARSPPAPWRDIDRQRRR